MEAVWESRHSDGQHSLQVIVLSTISSNVFCSYCGHTWLGPMVDTPGYSRHTRS